MRPGNTEIDTELDWAIKLHKSGMVEEAAEKYREILEAEPRHPEAGFLLGTLESGLGETIHAARHLAIGVLGLQDPSDAQIELIRLLQQASPQDQAEFVSWLSKNTEYHTRSDGAVAILRVLRILGMSREALQLALEITGQHADSLEFQRQLAALRFDAGQFEQALEIYARIYDESSEDLEVAVAYASALGKADHLEEALAVTLRAADVVLDRPDNALCDTVLTHLLECYLQLRREQDAVEYFGRLVSRNSKLAKGWSCLARAQYASGNPADAEMATSGGLKQAGFDVELAWLETFYSLPPLYESSEQISRCRANYRERLVKLASDLSAGDQETRSKAATLSGDITSYLLPYQDGADDIELQQVYGALISRLHMPENAPPPSVAPKSTDRIHVVFVSEFVWRHTNWRMKRSWLKYLDRQRFHVSCLHLGNRTDEMTEEIKGYSDAFYHFPNDLNGAQQLLIDIAPDVLFYLEVGMSGIVQRLAAQRFAPVQCCGIGHPVTTGLPTMDYFVSGELIEPPDSDRHYSETLVRLPGVSFPYIPAPLEPSTIQRSDFGLEDSAILYLCLQSPQKYLPSDDFLYPKIAKRQANAVFVFLDGASRIFDMSIIHNRLTDAFRAAGLSPELHLRFLPHLSPEHYQALNTIGDVALDTPGWSGGNTTLEALYQDLPVVTLPGDKMRACVSAGMLKLIGVEDTIAEDSESFVEIAVRLGNEPEWRKSISDKIRSGRRQLETDMSCMRAMEDFLEQAVNEAAGTPQTGKS